MTTTLITNIGTIISGDIKNPILSGNALLLEDGRIKQIGTSSEMQDFKPDARIDCAGTTVAPGLIDSHCHPVFGDYTPRQMQVGFLESEVHGGVTTFISAGEPHLPGRPKDRAGTKALAILGAKSFANFRPGGGKVIGGSVILEKGLTREDFAEMAEAGVRTVGEVGLGSVKDPEEAAQMLAWAREFGMTSMMHTGGTSIPGSTSVTADMVIRAGVDIAAHVNGGPTAIPLSEAEKLIRTTQVIIEIVHCGNPRMACEVLKLCQDAGCLDRVIIGNDAPSGTGVVPLGILRVVNHLASLTDLAPEQALCLAAGNTARVHKLDCGLIEPGRDADLVIMDAPMGSVGDDALSAIKAGDIPAVSMVLVEGQVVLTKSRNTPPTERMPALT